MAAEEHFDLRSAMVEQQIAARGIRDPLLLRAMEKVPRHVFVPGADARTAYGDFPVPIGSGQTISQPFIIALMIHMTGLRPGDRVLEVGTGSGYQTAILGAMGMDVVSVELRPSLAASARRALEETGLMAGIRMVCADGYDGWPPGAPYRGIIVSAAPPSVPQALVSQLSEGGRMVVPVGEGLQRLVLVTRRGGSWEMEAGE
ncbi:protein-L-isoaspartate(D-aspartate) O-methyltransferase, partial [Candidatus Fermentibacteria bacterium]|nr:protein-L-isoaspartate(D-aspartate) O-methyltransferase [Candidatus Fermentibacteria bacterium]